MSDGLVIVYKDDGECWRAMKRNILQIKRKKKQTDKETWGKDSCSSDSADTGEWIESSDEDMDSYDEEDEDWEIEMEKM